MRILVTGSSGTIGTRLCEKLLELGHDVIGVDWKPNKWQPNVQKLTRSVDLRSENEVAALTKALAKEQPIDAVFHLAANARVYELVEDPVRALDNVTTTFRTLELARTLGIKKILFSSSREVYGNEVRQDAYPEDAVRIEHCESPYTASKISGEAFVESYARCYGLDAIIFRFSNVYGMYDDSERVVPLFIRRAQKNEALTVFGKDKRLDFTYIDDNVNGMILGLQKFDAAKGETVNLGNSEGTTVIDLAETVKRLKKSSSPIIIGESRRGEVTHYVADITKARSLLGYKPVTPFAIGIQKAVEWYAEHPC